MNTIIKEVKWNMLNYVELDEMMKDLIYLDKLNKFFKNNGLTVETATIEDFYAFIAESHKGEIDRRTGKPISSISYTGDLEKINDLVYTYRKLKVILESLLENEVL